MSSTCGCSRGPYTAEAEGSCNKELVLHAAVAAGLSVSSFYSHLSLSHIQRKQKEVAKENEFYMQLLQQALPADVVQQNETENKANDAQTHQAGEKFQE